MPQSKEVHREYMKKRRQGSQDEGSQRQGSQKEGVTLKTRPNRLGADGLPEMVENEYNPMELLPNGYKRYIECHDGQVLDRLSVDLAASIRKGR